MGDLLGLKVAIKHSPKGGQVTLGYSTLDQLDMICQRLSGEKFSSSGHFDSPRSRAAWRQIANNSSSAASGPIPPDAFTCRSASEQPRHRLGEQIGRASADSCRPTSSFSFQNNDLPDDAMTAADAAALLDLGAQPGQQRHPPQHRADQGDPLQPLGVEPRQLGLERRRVAARDAVDQPA